MDLFIHLVLGMGGGGGIVGRERLQVYARTAVLSCRGIYSARTLAQNAGISCVVWWCLCCVSLIRECNLISGLWWDFLCLCLDRVYGCDLGIVLHMR